MPDSAGDEDRGLNPAAAWLKDHLLVKFVALHAGAAVTPAIAIYLEVRMLIKHL